MKIIKGLTTMLAGFFMITMLVHCGSDDELSGSLVGKWQGENIEAKVVALGLTVWEESDDTFNPELEFKEEGTVTVSDDGQETEGTWEKNGKTLHTNVDLNYQGFSGDQELTIKKLTETDLELYIEKDSTFEDPDTGFEVAGKLKATAYFKRLPD